MLYLAEPLKVSAPDESAKKTSVTLTAECQHGPYGRCVHCVGFAGMCSLFR
jgi:hypothetical protein